MTGATRAKAAPRGALDSSQKRTIALWEVGAFVWIMVAGSALHFTYELSGFSWFAALFGSVNESTWEHLKLFFWPGLVYALVQHAFVKDYANNYWWGKGLALLVTPIGVMVSFYFYLGIVLPLYGEGTLWGAIGTGAVGVLLGEQIATDVVSFNFTRQFGGLFIVWATAQPGQDLAEVEVAVDADAFGVELLAAQGVEPGPHGGVAEGVVGGGVYLVLDPAQAKQVPGGVEHLLEEILGGGVDRIVFAVEVILHGFEVGFLGVADDEGFRVEAVGDRVLG